MVLKIRNKKLHADNPVTEEGDAKTEDEESELVLHCPSCPCGNCLNLKVEMYFSENQQSEAEESSNCVEVTRIEL